MVAAAEEKVKRKSSARRENKPPSAGGFCNEGRLLFTFCFLTISHSRLKAAVLTFPVSQSFPFSRYQPHRLSRPCRYGHEYSGSVPL
jgi:hypothetical protein